MASDMNHRVVMSHGKRYESWGDECGQVICAMASASQDIALNPCHDTTDKQVLEAYSCAKNTVIIVTRSSDAAVNSMLQDADVADAGA